MIYFRKNFIVVFFFQIFFFFLNRSFFFCIFVTVLLSNPFAKRGSLNNNKFLIILLVWKIIFRSINRILFPFWFVVLAVNSSLNWSIFSFVWQWPVGNREVWEELITNQKWEGHIFFEQTNFNKTQSEMFKRITHSKFESQLFCF